jgi:signal transduction histidine kinase
VLPKAYTLAGDTKNAMDAFEAYTQLKDSMVAKQNMTQIANLEAEHTLELKDKKLQIAALSAKNAAKEKIILVSGVVLLVFACCLVFIVLRLRIIRQQATLKDIAYYQSHEVRGPVARILGLTEVFNVKEADPENQRIIGHMKTSATELDGIIKRIVKKAQG